MSFEVFMQVWCLQKLKLWWKQGKTGEKSQNRGEKPKQSNSHHPISETIGPISITSWSSFHTYYISFQILGSQESIGSNGARFGVKTKNLWPFEDDCAKLNGNVAAAPISLLLDTFLENFIKLKLCIPYVFLNLRKLGVHCFKRCVIWIWNEEVMAIWKNLISHLGGWMVPCANFWASSSLPSPIPTLWALSSVAQSGAHSSFL